MERRERDDVETLLFLARRLDNEGNSDGAREVYQLALERLPQDDRRRASVERILQALQPPRATSKPEIIPMRTSAQTIPPSRASSPRAGWLILGCAALIALTIPVFVALAYAQSLAQASAPLSAALPASPTASSPGFPQGTLVTSVPTPAPTVASNATPVRSAVTFQDTFTTLDPFKWVVKNNTGTTVDNSEGVLRLASSTTHFPYVYTPVNPIPTAGNFRVTVRYRYPQVGACGAPIALASFRLPEGLSHDETNRVSQAAETSGGLSLWIWYSVIYYRNGAVHQDIQVPNTPGAWHVATIDYRGGVYTLSIDGTLIFTAPPTTVRPQLVWLGNPFEMDSNCQWDTLEVSTLLVETMP